jgi:hypothetical protein
MAFLAPRLVELPVPATAPSSSTEAPSPFGGCASARGGYDVEHMSDTGLRGREQPELLIARAAVETGEELAGGPS